MLLLPIFAASCLQAGAYTERVSLDSNEFEGNAASEDPVFCADGRYVAFASTATNLVGNDTNGLRDVFVRARHADRTVRVSVDSSGTEANGASFDPAISADGRFIAFASDASTLVSGDGNGATDVFVHDSVTGVTERVSLGALGMEANGASTRPAISAEGRYVAFTSVASNLIPGDGNGVGDVFVHDRWIGLTERLSVTSLGGEAHGASRAVRLSGDGRFAVFESDAPDLVTLDANGVTDAFLHDRMTGGTLRISVSSGGGEGLGPSFAPDVSTDGFSIVFTSAAANLVAGDTNGVDDVFLRDRRGGVTTRVSVSSSGAQASARSGRPALIPDGGILAFESEAPDIAAGDSNGVSDVFLHIRATAVTERVSLRTGGGQADAASSAPSCAVDARVIAFRSAASNLVPGDGNGADDVFVRNRGLSTAGTQTTKILTVQPILSTGSRASFSLFVVAPGNPWWLLASFSDAGILFGGNTFELGPPVTVLASGFADARGTAAWASPPLPAAFAGRTLFIQAAARSDSGEVDESNLLARLVR